MLCVNELVTAVEQRLDLTAVCVDNGGYAEIKQNEVDRGIDPVGVDLVQPGLVALANAFGATGPAGAETPRGRRRDHGGHRRGGVHDRYPVAGAQSAQPSHPRGES